MSKRELPQTEKWRSQSIKAGRVEHQKDRQCEPLIAAVIRWHGPDGKKLLCGIETANSVINNHGIYCGSSVEEVGLIRSQGVQKPLLPMAFADE